MAAVQKRKAFLEITNICNLSCAFCPKTSRQPKMLTAEEFRLLSGKLRPFADYLYFHLMGEPTCHPELPAFAAYAKELGFRPMLTTNGTLLSSRGNELTSSFYKISISLHAPEANEDNRIPAAYFDTCLDFVQKAADAGTICALRLWNLGGRTDHALHENNDAILSLLHSRFRDPWIENRSGYRLSDRIFLEWGEKFDWASLSSPVLQDHGFCYGLRDQIGVLCEGTVVPCCLDAEGAIPLGNLFTADLEDILASPRAKSLYDGFTQHMCREELCRRCMRASYYR